ncbi:MAG: FlgD immunoglobulin-like domain containing protein, partial [Chitinispirillia bacterium]
SKYYSVTKNVPAALENKGIGSTSYTKIPVENVGIINKTQKTGNPLVIKIKQSNFKSSGVEIHLGGPLRNTKINIYNSEGKSVRSFQTKEKTIFWNGRDREGSVVPPGAYIITVNGDGDFASAKFVLKKN